MPARSGTANGKARVREQAVHVEGEERAAGARALIVCEHASLEIPPRHAELGLAPESRQSHVAWDPGALELARHVAQALGAPLVHGGLSRLVYDLNRPPNAADAMPARSEVHFVPGNADLGEEERLLRVREIYLPFHAELRRLVAEALARGERPALVTIHSFTPSMPVSGGKRKSVSSMTPTTGWRGGSRRNCQTVFRTGSISIAPTAQKMASRTH